MYSEIHELSHDVTNSQMLTQNLIMSMSFQDRSQFIHETTCSHEAVDDGKFFKLCPKTVENGFQLYYQSR